MASNEREVASLSGDFKPRQSDGYYDCLNERIRLKDILRWFVLQAAARDEKGRFKPSFEVVRLALQRGIPGIDDIYWDFTKQEVIVKFHRVCQPFSQLSDGQRTMAATIADMAIRAVALNSHLLGDGNGHSHPEAVLDHTPGVVLIDELDVHLHPAWQRSVVKELTATFPKVQFICSSHSPQVQGEVPANAIWILGDDTPRHPTVSYADSNWNLEHQMGRQTPSRSEKVKEMLDKAEEEMGEGDLMEAKQALEAARNQMGGADGQLTRLESSLETLESLAREDD
jgi:predicted ATP-binding protein involved in virulence